MEQAIQRMKRPRDMHNLINDLAVLVSSLQSVLAADALLWLCGHRLHPPHACLPDCLLAAH